ncbi:MAG: PQ-loop domain-containing transporter [Candidatus Gastranaerophilales bacterium]|nr:PQ-loop domain-containing transporter [Candidatus Gastranaerophilales bacterium]
MPKEFYGYIAGILMSIAYLPQIYRVLKTKSAKDFSYWMLGLYASATFLWGVHGLIFKSNSMVIFNGVVFLQILAVIMLKFFYSKK